MRKLLLLFVWLLFAWACANSENDKIYREAFEKQKEIIAEIGEINELLSTSTIGVKDSLKAIIHELEETLFEIPGYSLELPGHEGHDHSHGHSDVALSAEQVLNVQVEMLSQLKEIRIVITQQQ